ncbi:hypothetical protein DY245_01905 [Streptomyces inhibens]|uniref:Uncharacterized protein n=1 Tax=Streptomyces inhibens TaxID=2293571 RepID=A0A371QAW3_STRIH|nr:hypothetical protein DY245_01905 [Streptomyces inhibens]
MRSQHQLEGDGDVVIRVELFALVNPLRVGGRNGWPEQNDPQAQAQAQTRAGETAVRLAVRRCPPRPWRAH